MNGFHSAWASSWQQTIIVKPSASGPSIEPTASHPIGESATLNPTLQPIGTLEKGNTPAAGAGNNTLDWDPPLPNKTNSSKPQLRQRKTGTKK